MFKQKNKPPGKGKVWKPHSINPKLKDHQDFTPQKQPGWKILGQFDVRESAVAGRIQQHEVKAAWQGRGLGCE